MNLVFLHGPPAAGKLTVARALSAQTGLPLFHNHLIVDAVGAVFEFGAPPFRRLRERFWLDTFEAAAEARRSLIFTFAPEATVSPGFPEDTVRTVAAHGGRVRFIGLTCPPEEQERRLDTPERATFGKLRSLDQLRTLRAAGAFDYPALPTELMLDTNRMAPNEAAERIAALLVS